LRQKLKSRRQAKFESKVALIQARDFNQHKSAHMLHQNLRASHTKGVQEAAPSLSEFLGPVFVDCDPEQGVEDEYKHKH
jgi:hypothetical protein